MAFQFSITYGMHRMQYMYVGLNLYSVEMALNLNVLYSMNLNRNTNESLAAYFDKVHIPYARHRHLITSCSWIQAIHKDRIFWKKLFKNKEMVFENGIKNIQAAAYNGARTVHIM